MELEIGKCYVLIQVISREPKQIYRRFRVVDVRKPQPNELFVNLSGFVKTAEHYFSFATFPIVRPAGVLIKRRR